MRPFGWAVVMVTSVAFLAAIAAFAFSEAPEVPVAEALGPLEDQPSEGSEEAAGGTSEPPSGAGPPSG